MASKRKILMVALFLFVFMFCFQGVALAQKVYNDVEEGRWSEKNIAKMKSKGIFDSQGVGDGNFAPKDSVTNEQLLVMLVRTLGKDKETGTLPSSYLYKDEVSIWAKNAFSYAINKNIFTDTDFLDKPGDSIKRYKAAVYMVRALGLTAEAESKSVSLNFSDKDLIPEWARGYVAVANEKKIMEGSSDGAFSPLEVVTREQMAAILARVDNHLDLPRENVFKGKVYAINTSSGSILVEDASENIYTVPILDAAFIYRKNDKINYTDLKGSEYVEIIKNSLGEAEYIEIIPEGDFSYNIVKVTGKIDSLILGDDSTYISLTVGNEKRSYEAEYNISVNINGETASLNDLRSGQEITIVLENGKVKEIDAKNIDFKLEAIFESVDFLDQSITVINATTNNKEIYVVDSWVRVEKDAKDASLRDLVTGDKLELELRNNEIRRIKATTVTDDLEGEVKEVILSLVPRIVITTEAGKEVEYKVDKDADIRKDRKRIDISEVRPGDLIEVEMEGEYVVKITLESAKKGKYIIGVVDKVYDADEVLVVTVNAIKENSDLILVENQKRTIYFTKDVDVILDGRYRYFEDIEEGDEVLIVSDPSKDYFEPSMIVIIEE